MTFFLAPSLVRLRDEINARYPARDKTSDGWIGDTSHSARASDHNPDYSEGGIVRAIDIDIDGGTPADPLVQTILKATIGDSRVYYVIFNGKIYSRTYGFEARTYTGTNPHDKHIHVSVRNDNASERDAGMWLAGRPRTKALPIFYPALREQFIAARDGKKVVETDAVRRVQKALNATYGKHLTADGIAGEATLNSYGRHERAVGVKGNPRIPDAKTLTSLVRGKYRISGLPVDRKRKATK